jgi:hypothetical protein
MDDHIRGTWKDLELVAYITVVYRHSTGKGSRKEHETPKAIVGVLSR